MKGQRGAVTPPPIKVGQYANKETGGQWFPLLLTPSGGFAELRGGGGVMVRGHTRGHTRGSHCEIV